MSTVNERNEEQTQMRVVIFGSTGTVGQELVKQALEQGYMVTAFARNPAKVTVRHENLDVVQGDALDPASVERAIHGHDAVLCSLGDGAKGKIRAEGTQTIISAMEKTNVRRLIVQSSMGVGNSVGNLNFFWKYIMFGLLLRKAHADNILQEEHVLQCSLDWTIVRPGAFTDGARTGNYRHGFSGTDRTTKMKVSRADVADFMLKQLNDDTYFRATPGLSY